MTPLLAILLESSIRISLVAAVAGLILILGKVHSSSLQHTVWLTVLCAMLLMPVLPFAVPPVGVPVPVFPGGLSTVSVVAEPLNVDVSAPLSPMRARAVPAISAPRHPQPRRPMWPAAVLAVYAVGVLVFLCRLIVGWLSVRRVLRTSARIPGQSAPVYESPALATPVTVGIIAPRVMLPSAWSQWPEDKLRAVLAHEMAHIARRDTITNLLAQLNRCLFWFHPLAWYLERKLAVTSEQASDDAAVRAVGESRKYAEVLLDMAEAMRQKGSRLSWQGVGVDGTGVLGQRIDRILRGGPFTFVSRRRKLLTVLGCAAAILIVAACRQKSIYSGELKEDPAYAARLASHRADAEFRNVARAMSAQQVAVLEAVVAKNPEDLDARKRLMIFYQSSGRKALGDEKTIAAFRAHKLWFIQYHPDNGYASLASPLPDLAGYEQARKLWLALIQRKDASAPALANSAYFFESGDKQLAERLFLRAQAADPKRDWSHQFALLYASVLTESKTHGAYAQDVRKKLDRSKDPALLAATAMHLVRKSQGMTGELGSGYEALAISYLERALQLNPNSKQARMMLVAVQRIKRQSRLLKTFGWELSDTQRKAVSALPTVDRFEILATLAHSAYIRGEALDYYKHDQPGARAAWESARKYAQEALQLAPGFTSSADYGTVLYQANMTLGMVAIRVDGDVKSASKYLLEASKAPPSEELGYGQDYFTTKLPTMLLKYGGAGARQAVVEYLERYGAALQRRDLLEAAGQLRRGYIPEWYQYQVAKLK